MNPLTQYKWIIETVCFAVLLGALGWCVHEYGGRRFDAGVAHQTGIDQKEFDRINTETATNKATANRLLADAQSTIIAQQQSWALQHAHQESQHAQDQAATDAARRALAAHSLRVTVNVPQATGCGGSSAGAVPDAAAAPNAARTEVIQLPAQVTSDLRQLALDADIDADNYRACYRGFHPEQVMAK